MSNGRQLVKVVVGLNVEGEKGDEEDGRQSGDSQERREKRGKSSSNKVAKTMRESYGKREWKYLCLVHNELTD